MDGQRDRRYVLVGYDGSEEANQVLKCAAAEARARYLPLAVCHAYRWPYPTRPGEDRVLRILADSADQVVRRGVMYARQFAPGVEVDSWSARGSAAGLLAARSAGAELVVVGARGSGGFAELPLGSVAQQVAAHASCPVLVVRGADPAARDASRQIVAVVDGSPGDEAVLAFAFEQAALRHAPLQVVHGRNSGEPVPTPGDTAALFERTVAPWLEKYRHVEARTWWSEEAAIDALATAAQDSAQLVVVDRRAGGPATLPLGTVALAMLHQAPCPVAVTRAP